MYNDIPDAMKACPQWVCWQGEQRNGKLTKIPINPLTGGRAKSNDPSTWTTFDIAVQAAKDYDGIGFMFAPPFFGVDLDHVIATNGERKSIVDEFIHKLKSYAEYSPSGTGIHIICKGTLPDEGRRRGNVEMYQSGRFFTVTGDSASEYTDVVECTEAIKTLHAKYIAKPKRERKPAQTQATVLLGDSEIIDKARNAKNGAKFDALWNGDTSAYDGDDSRADEALCNILAFWTGRNIAQMDRLFRQSGLMRDKWDRPTAGSTYGCITLEKAANECCEIYTPNMPFHINFGATAPKLQTEEKIEASLHTFDDTGNAERLIEAYGDVLLYCKPSDRWYYYNGKVWAEDRIIHIRQLCKDVINRFENNREAYLACVKFEGDQREYEDKKKAAEKKFSTHLKNSRQSKGQREMIEMARSYVSITPEELDKYKLLLNTQNRVFDLESGITKKHDATLHLTKITTGGYDKAAECPKWLAFLKDIFAGDQETIDFVQRAVGYSLTGSTQEHCVFFLYGDGRNGKSTFLSVITALFGDYATNIQPETIMVKYGSQNGATTDIARLKGARLVTCSEPADGQRIHESLLKQLTGGDKVTARFLYRDNFEFTPEFKLWMATNYKPIIRGTDEGIWRRIRLIPFTVQIPQEKVNPKLSQELVEELPGILNWALDGFKKWRGKGLGTSSAVQEATKSYRSEMDALSAWFEECCTRNENERETSPSLYRSYQCWAERGNEFIMSNRKFGREMSKRFESTRSNGVTYYKGIKLIYTSDDSPNGYRVTFDGKF